MTWDLSPADARDKGAQPSRRKSLKRKDTRRWCGGHVGREHQRHIIAERFNGRPCFVGVHWSRVRGTGEWERRERWVCWHLEACEVCGKHLRTIVDCPDKPEGWAPAEPVRGTREELRHL